MSKSKISDLQQNDSSNEVFSIESLAGAARISKLESQVEFLTKQKELIIRYPLKIDSLYIKI